MCVKGPILMMPLGVKSEGQGNEKAISASGDSLRVMCTISSGSWIFLFLLPKGARRMGHRRPPGTRSTSYALFLCGWKIFCDSGRQLETKAALKAGQQLRKNEWPVIKALSASLRQLRGQLQEFCLLAC